MDAETLLKIVAALTAICLGLGGVIWKLAEKLSKIREEFHLLLEQRVSERNTKLDNLRAEAFTKIERCNAEIAMTNNALAQYKLEAYKEYARRADVDNQLERLENRTLLKFAQLDTLMDKLIAKAGQALLR